MQEVTEDELSREIVFASQSDVMAEAGEQSIDQSNERNDYTIEWPR